MTQKKSLEKGEIVVKEKFSLREWFIMAFSMLLIAVGVHYIMIPCEIMTGSISGLAVVLAKILPFSTSVITFVLNTVLFVIGYILIGKEFGAKTLITSMMLPIYLAIFEKISPSVMPIVDDKLTAMIVYLFIGCYAQAMLFNINASSGGLDIVGKLINKYLRMELGPSMQLCGFVTAASAIVVYDIETLVYAMLGTYLSGIILDYFIDGDHMRKRICILSQNQDAIRSFIVDELHRGVTMYEVQGGLNNEKKMEIVTVLQKNEYQLLIDFIQKTDQSAFITVSTVGQVIGHWANKKHYN